MKNFKGLSPGPGINIKIHLKSFPRIPELAGTLTKKHSAGLGM